MPDSDTPDSCHRNEAQSGEESDVLGAEIPAQIEPRMGPIKTEKCGKSLILAGKEGFEPSKLVIQLAGFRIRTLRNFRKAMARK